MKCELGPASRNFGGSAWLVYGCEDMHSVVAVTASGPAFPFYFMLHYKDGAYRIYGEGTGHKVATEAAHRELSAMKPEDIQLLFKEAESVKKP